MSGWRSRSATVIAGAGVALVIAACGSASSGSGNSGNDPGSSHSAYKVSVTTASFPARQVLAGNVHLVISVRNAGRRAIPDVAVTICNSTCSYKAARGQGATVQPFSYAANPAPNLANDSRPIWIVQQSPGTCGYSCKGLGAGAAVTANSNTWALGRLAPGRTARFNWAVTPVKTGRYVVAWEVAGALGTDTKATLAGGSPAKGSFKVDVSTKPPNYTVKPDGQVVASR